MILICEIHRCEAVTAAALSGVVRLEFLPYRLRQFGTMAFVFRRSIEFAKQVLLHFYAGLHMSDHPGNEFWRNMAVRTHRAHTGYILIVDTLRVFLKWRFHFMTGMRAEVHGVRVVNTFSETTG